MKTLLERNIQLNGYRHCDICKELQTCDEQLRFITNLAYRCGKYSR